MTSSDRYSLTVFGATGFTARFVIQTIAEQVEKIVSSGDDARFSWAIAGRNESALEKIRDGLKDKIPNEKLLPHVVVADVKNQASLKKMAQGTRLLLNCVGPYAFLGEAVVKAVLSANESGDAPIGSPPTDYIDLSGEPAWIEEMILRYGDRASRLGCSIIHAAAFDSVPSDLGAILAKQQLITKSATPTSIETFIRLYSQSGQKLGIHYATYEAAVNGFSTRKQLSFVRKQLYAKLPKLTAAPLQGYPQRSNGLPKRQGRLRGAITYVPPTEEYVGDVYVLPFFFADPAVVRLSQHLSAHLGQGELNPPVQYVFWFVVRSLPGLLVALVALSLFGILATFPIGRSLLLRFPTVFSAGMVTHTGPTQEQLDDYSFATTMVARGYSKAASKDEKQVEPDVKSVIRIRGPEVGYVSTPILFVQVARTFLRERSKINNGVLTPGSALLQTSLVDRLNEEGRVTFSVLS